GALLRVPPPIDLSHIAMPRVTVAARLEVLRALLRRGSFSFDEAVADADRVTVCVTVFALLELYKRGEAAWEQDEPFGPITVASESATSALTDRGLIEEAGRSQFGAVLYRTTPLFLTLFGLDSPDALPDAAQWDPSPEEATALRDRLLRAGEARGDAAAAR